MENVYDLKNDMYIKNVDVKILWINLKLHISIVSSSFFKRLAPLVVYLFLHLLLFLFLILFLILFLFTFHLNLPFKRGLHAAWLAAL